MSNKAILLVNLGSPDSTAVQDVRTYLREFLMDGRVLDALFPVRWCVVNFAILPKRPHQSAEAYEKIWTPEGSPLVVSTHKVAKLLRRRTGLRVEFAMRYRNPSIMSAVTALRDDGIDEILLIPLFPHYAMSSYETAVERVREVVRQIAPAMSLTVMPPYYDHPDYIRALTANAEDFLSQAYDHLLFSFHGIPERHLRKSDPTGGHQGNLAETCGEHCTAPETCYRSQCLKTAEAFAQMAGIPKSKYSIAFQSRLGRDPWLKPYADFVIEDLAKAGTKKLLVICPSFVSDCLETLEEMGIRGRESFLAAGGAEFHLIPCLNEQPLWLDFLEKAIGNFAAQQSHARHDDQHCGAH